jgi:hypothetical protein
MLDATNEFLRLLLTTLPFFMLGAVAGAVLQTFVSARYLVRFFGGSGLGSVLSAVGAGAVLPGCACATMPMAAGLGATRGSRLGTVAAFIVVSPILSPVTVALTWGMIGWEMTVARVVAGLAGSILLGVIINRFEGWFTTATRARVTAMALASTPVLVPLGGDPELTSSPRDDACCAAAPRSDAARIGGYFERRRNKAAKLATCSLGSRQARFACRTRPRSWISGMNFGPGAKSLTGSSTTPEHSANRFCRPPVTRWWRMNSHYFELSSRSVSRRSILWAASLTCFATASRNRTFHSRLHTPAF